MRRAGTGVESSAFGIRACNGTARIYSKEPIQALKKVDRSKWATRQLQLRQMRVLKIKSLSVDLPKCSLRCWISREAQGVDVFGSLPAVAVLLILRGAQVKLRAAKAGCCWCWSRRWCWCWHWCWCRCWQLGWAWRYVGFRSGFPWFFSTPVFAVRYCPQKVTRPKKQTTQMHNDNQMDGLLQEN